jgi:hypothetical protein
MASRKARATVLVAHRPVLIESLPVPPELLPGDGPGVVPRDEERPVFGADLSGPPLDPRVLAGQAQTASLGPAVDKGARVPGVMQDGQGPAVAQGAPGPLTVAGPAPEPGGAAEVMVGEVLDDGEGRTRLLERVEDRPDRMPDLFVGVEHDPSLGVIDQPRGRPESESAVSGLLQLAAQQAGAEPVQFGLAHGAQEAQEKAVGGVGGVADPVLVDDQRVSQCTDFDQTIPVAAGTSQA